MAEDLPAQDPAGLYVFDFLTQTPPLGTKIPNQESEHRQAGTKRTQ